MSLVRADSLAVPLADASVDLVVTSPPYWGLRLYEDGGEHFAGQIGNEADPFGFLEHLWDVTAELARVLKPGGSIWVNLGDKYAEKAGPARGMRWQGQDREHSRKAERPPRRFVQGMRPKSLMGLPWRYAIGCMDHLGLILRAEVVWEKLNPLPESAGDRAHRTHEQWFHFTRSGSYYSAVDEVRQQSTGRTMQLGPKMGRGASSHTRRDDDPHGGLGRYEPDPLGKMPGSVWSIASEKLEVPIGFVSDDGQRWRAMGSPVQWDSAGARVQRQHLWDRAVEAHLAGRPLHVSQVDHFAAFPQEWPRRIILGWSPSGHCLACEEPRRPVVTVDQEPYREAGSTGRPKQQVIGGSTGNGRNGTGYPQTKSVASIDGYSCACPTPDAPTRPAVVLDPFVGTGTTVMVARALGRQGVGLDLSEDYLRLASWRVHHSGHASRTRRLTNLERQGRML